MKKIILLLLISLSISVSAQDNFKVKAFHIDNRIQVMPIQELKDLALHLQKSGINTIIMEYEGSFPFTENGVISNRYSYTKEEVKDFIDYCALLNMDVIPLQQCLGHLEYILKFDKYSALREDQYDVSQICPLKKEENRKFYSDIISEIIDLHPSKYVHIGGDEAFLLGHCDECQKYVEQYGQSRLFVDHIKMITEIIIEKGKIPVLWADIILKHPEAISDLPKQCILINWNYGWDIDRFGNHDNLVNSGLEFWGALSLRSSPDNFFLTSWRTHFKNLEDFIPLMRKYNYQGIVMTSWSTSGGYTYLREPKNHIIEMFPIRHVYPLSGFKMSVAAYAEAILDEHFDAHKFVSSYVIKNFGLDAEDAETFWTGLNVPVETIKREKTSTNRSLADLLEETAAFTEFLHQLKISSNKKEFEHYILMYDIRQYYIESKIIQVEIEDMDFTPENIELNKNKLSELKKTGKSLNKRFEKLNKKSLHPGSIEEENFIRNREVDILYNSLTKKK